MGAKRTTADGTKSDAGLRRKPRRRGSQRDAVVAARRYTVIYQAAPPEDGGGFYAYVPALDITTEGETLNEARTMARDAIECYLETARDIGQAIPEEVTSETVEIGV